MPNLDENFERLGIHQFTIYRCTARARLFFLWGQGNVHRCLRASPTGSMRKSGVTIRRQVSGGSLPPLAIFVAPENCRYHAVSKVNGSQILWLIPFRASNPIVAHGVGVPSDQIIAELSMLRDGTAANQISWL